MMSQSILLRSAAARTLLAALTLCLFSATALAQPAAQKPRSNEEMMEVLFSATGMDETIIALGPQLASNYIDELAQLGTLTDEHKKQIEAATKANFSPAKMRENFLLAFKARAKAEDANEAIEFYLSPVGKKVSAAGVEFAKLKPETMAQRTEKWAEKEKDQKSKRFQFAKRIEQAAKSTDWVLTLMEAGAMAGVKASARSQGRDESGDLQAFRAEFAKAAQQMRPGMQAQMISAVGASYEKLGDDDFEKAARFNEQAGQVRLNAVILAAFGVMTGETTEAVLKLFNLKRT
jgi:hypothetical protein